MTYSLIIPDISFWQDDPKTSFTPDFYKMKAAGAAGVIIRAGQGDWPDRDFERNWREAKAAGLLRGTYFFYDSRFDPVQQAALFIGAVNGDLPELGYWADFEENYGGAWAGWRNWKKFLDLLRQTRPASLVGVYTAPYYWQANKPTNATDLAYFKQFPLWQAQYASRPQSMPPWDDSQRVFWQFTSSGDGLKYGVESREIDLNYFQGTAEDFAKKFGGVVVPPPPPTGDTMQYKVVWNNGVARRTRPATTNSYTGLVYPFNMTVEVLEDNIPDADDPTNANKRWVKFAETLADGTPLYGASDYPDSIGVPRVRMEKVAEPEPEPAPSRNVVKGVLHFDDGTTEELFPAAE